jgi:hypothetical protein
MHLFGGYFRAIATKPNGKQKAAVIRRGDQKDSLSVNHYLKPYMGHAAKVNRGTPGDMGL